MLARKFLIAALVAALGFSSAGVSADVPVHYVFQVPLKGVAQPASGSTTTPTTSGPQYAWVDQSQECPPGEEGSITWQEVFEVSPDYRSTGQTRDYQDTCMPPLGVPTLAGPASVDPGATYSVAWNAISTATHYQLGLNDGQSTSTVYDGASTSASSVASTTIGHVDQLWARACDATRCGDWSAPVSVTVIDPANPASPAVTAPATVVTGQNVTVSWTAVSSPGGYPVHYEMTGQTADGTQVTPYSGANLSATVVASAPAGSTYTFSVRACDTYGCSGWKSASTAVNPTVPTVPAFASTPSTVYPGAAYTVNWGAVAGATRYELSSWDDAVGNPVVVYKGSSTSFSTTAGTTVGQIQAYAVRACNVSGCSGFQPQQNVKVVNPPTPAAPTISAQSTVIAGNSVTVSWGASSSPGGYALHYELVSNKDGGAASPVYNGPATSATGVSSATPAGSTYGFGVRACDTYNCSGYTWTSTLVEVAAPTSAPTISATSSVYPGKTVAVSWTSVAGATSYDIEYFVNGADQGLAYSGAATSLTTGAASGTVGTVYAYKARACNSTGCSGWSAGASSTVVDPPNPATPTTLNAPSSVIAGGNIALSWGGSSSPQGYTFHYEVVYNTGSGNVSVYSGTGTSATITNAGPSGATYNLYVRGCDTYGCSGWKQATTVVNPPAPATPSLSVPSSVYPSKGYTVSWGASTYASRYELYEGGVGTIYSGSATSLARTASGTVGDTDSYQIRACNVTGCSAYSATDTITVANPPAPSEPSSLSVPSTVAPGGSMSISWGTSSDPEGYAFTYRLYGRLGTSGTWTLHNNSTARSDTVTAPTTTGTYNWIVRACDAYNCSTDRTGSTTVQAAIPSTPTLTVADTSAGQPINVSWSAVSGATSYELRGDAGTSASTLRYSGTGRSFSISTAMNRRDSSYTVSVRACNSNGCSGLRTQTVTVYGSG